MASWKSFKKGINLLRTIPVKERGLLFQASILIPLVVGLLNLGGFTRLHQILSKFLHPIKRRSAAESEIISEEAIQPTVNAVELALRLSFFRPKCLAKSYVLWWLLARQSIHADLCIGVKKENSLLEGHAWVESDGIVLNDSADVQTTFVPITRVTLPN
jgi:hypothetical protein